MSERDALKSRLSAEVATVIFGDGDVPSGVWDCLDDLVEDAFGESPTGQLRSLVDDVAEVRASDGRIEREWARTEPPARDREWTSLEAVIGHATRELAPNRDAGIDDDEASGARTLEMVSHGQR